MRLHRPRHPLLCVALLLALAGAALAAARLTATRTRIADHPAYVRAVIAFTGGSLRSGELTATDPDPADGSARVRLRHARVRATAPPAAAHGLRVRVAPSANGLTVAATAAPRTFKYLGYHALHHPERLVLDLWKSTPPSPNAHVRQGAGGCLTLGRVVAPPGRITVGGREHGLFEHSFSVVVRSTAGRVLARRSVVAAGGRWSARIDYTESRRQAGTLEAVAGSPKDGALACLAQARVILATREAAP